MVAGDIVGMNFQLWAGVGFGVSGEQQVGRRLSRIGLLGMGADHHTSAVDTAAAPVEYAAEQLAATGIECIVYHAHIDIGVTPSVEQGKSGECGFGVIFNQVDHERFTRKFGSKIQIQTTIVGTRTRAYRGVAQQARAGTGFIETDMQQLRPGGQ